MKMHIAQLNISFVRAPKDDPVFADFVSELDHINSQADASPGFVWRLAEEDDGVESQRVFDNEKILVNMSVWESAETLRSFVYQGDHASILRKRRKWFKQHVKAYIVLWWISAGHRPSLEEAKQKLDLLLNNGPSSDAFSLSEPFPEDASR
jgi:hypothetical protein